MSKAQLKKYIQGLDREHLEEFILDIYSDVKPAKEYLDFFLNPDVEKVVAKTQQALYSKLYRPSGEPIMRLKFTKINDIMKDFTAKVRDPYVVADMMEYLLALLCGYGSHYCHDEAFVRSLVANFGRFSKWLVKHSLEKEYQEKMDELIRRTWSIGWDCTSWVRSSIDDSFHTPST